MDNLRNFSDQLKFELCMYGLLNKQYKPEPTVCLEREVPAIGLLPNTKPMVQAHHTTNITKITIGDFTFMTHTKNLYVSPILKSKLVRIRSNTLELSDTDFQIFRHVLNLLRYGEIFVNSQEIVDLLSEYKIPYILPTQAKSDEHDYLGVCNYNPHPSDGTAMQQSKYIGYFDPRNFPKINNQGFHQFTDNSHYIPSNTNISYATENMNIIHTTSPLKFGSKLIFDLNGLNKNNTNATHYDCIEDLVLVIDIPVKITTDKDVITIPYHSFAGHHLIDNINIIKHKDNQVQTIFSTTGQTLYMHPIVYTTNPTEYHSITKFKDTPTKVLYNNTLIDIHRLTIPLHFPEHHQNHLPIGKSHTENSQLQLVVDVAPVNKIIAADNLHPNLLSNIPLLNTNLMCNLVTMPSVIPTLTLDPKTKKQQIVQTTINVDFKTQPHIYLYNHTHNITIPTKNLGESINELYHTITIPLDRFGLIKDFYLIVVSEEDHNNGVLDKYIDALLELEIFEIKTPNQVILHTQLDGTIMNQYIPLRKLGHNLPQGLYYYSFSSDPMQNKILGGFMGKSSMMRLKIKKLDCLVKLFVRQYTMNLF